MNELYESIMVRVVLQWDQFPEELRGLLKGMKFKPSFGEGLDQDPSGRELVKYNSRGCDVRKYVASLGLDRYTFVGLYIDDLCDGRCAIKMVLRDPQTVTIPDDVVASRQNLYLWLEYYLGFVWTSVYIHANPGTDEREKLSISLAGREALEDFDGNITQVQVKKRGMVPLRELVTELEAA